MGQLDRMFDLIKKIDNPRLNSRLLKEEYDEEYNEIIQKSFDKLLDQMGDIREEYKGNIMLFDNPDMTTYDYYRIFKGFFQIIKFNENLDFIKKILNEPFPFLTQINDYYSGTQHNQDDTVIKQIASSLAEKYGIPDVGKNVLLWFNEEVEYFKAISSQSNTNFDNDTLNERMQINFSGKIIRYFIPDGAPGNVSLNNRNKVMTGRVLFDLKYIEVSDKRELLGLLANNNIDSNLSDQDYINSIKHTFGEYVIVEIDRNHSLLVNKRNILNNETPNEVISNPNLLTYMSAEKGNNYWFKYPAFNFENGQLTAINIPGQEKLVNKLFKSITTTSAASARIDDRLSKYGYDSFVGSEGYGDEYGVEDQNIKIVLDNCVKSPLRIVTGKHNKYVLRSHRLVSFDVENDIIVGVIINVKSFKTKFGVHYMQQIEPLLVGVPEDAMQFEPIGKTLENADKIIIE